MKKQKPLSLQKTRKTSTPCKDCGVISKDVSKSIKYNVSLCIDCFKTRIIKDLKE